MHGMSIWFRISVFNIRHFNLAFILTIVQFLEFWAKPFEIRVFRPPVYVYVNRLSFYSISNILCWLSTFFFRTTNENGFIMTIRCKFYFTEFFVVVAKCRFCNKKSNNCHKNYVFLSFASIKHDCGGCSRFLVVFCSLNGVYYDTLSSNRIEFTPFDYQMVIESIQFRYTTLVRMWQIVYQIKKNV